MKLHLQLMAELMRYPGVDHTFHIYYTKDNGNNVVYVTHDASIVSTLCAGFNVDHVDVIKAGDVIAKIDGNGKEVSNEATH